MAIRAYNSPGVTVSQTINPAIAPLLASPSIVAVVGPAAGNQAASERLLLSGTTAVTLRYTGVVTNSVVVLNISGLTVSPGAYTVTQSTDPDSTVTGDEVYTIARKTQPTAAPTVATGTGTLVGTYHYKYTYVNAAGETGASPQSTDIVLATQGASLSGITIGPAGTTARNVYREKVVGSVGQGFHLVATIADNVTTVLTNETTSDATAANGASPSTGITDGETVTVSYTYTDNFYYEATLLDDYDDIVQKYGPPFDTNGNISSQLAFVARLLFLNGASEVLCVASLSGSAADIDVALAKLENQPNVRFVSVASATVGADVVAHVNKMNAQGYYRIAVLGQDGTGTAITAASLRSAAQGYNNEAIQLVNVGSFQMQNPVTGRIMNVGGQYAAAAVTGMWAARDVQFPLTRKSVAGFVGINDKRTASDLALDSAAGLLVIDNKGGVLQIRHSLTTAVGDVNTREGSVVRAKYDMAHRIQASLDAGIVGLVVPASQVPLTVQQAVIGILEQLVIEGAINDYNDVKARVLTGDPTTVEVRYSYQPAYPINNISVIFTINTATGDFALSG